MFPAFTHGRSYSLLGQVVTDTRVTEHQKSQQRVNVWLAIHVLEIAQKQITAMLVNNEHNQMKIKDALLTNNLSAIKGYWREW